MGEYRVDDDTVLFHVVDGNEKTIATFKPAHLWAANHLVDVLNTETAPLIAEIERLKAELELAQGIMKNVMDNLPSEDLSRVQTPQWMPTVWSAYIANRTIKRYFDSFDDKKEESETK